MPSEIDTLLRLVPDRPDAVLTHLRSTPSLAHVADTNGYSLIHAAASYSKLDLLRTLVRDFSVDVNKLDSDGQSALFIAETVPTARCLVEELHADTSLVDHEGIDILSNARENADDDGGTWADVASYLSSKMGGIATEEEEDVRRPPKLPEGVQFTGMQAVPENEEGVGVVDPEFRRRIEELAAREDFSGERGQEELRRLVEEAVGGLAGEERSVRART